MKSSLATSERGAWRVNKAMEGEEGLLHGREQKSIFGEHKSGQTQISPDVKPVSLRIIPTFTLPAPRLPVWNTGAQASPSSWRIIPPPASLTHQSSSWGKQRVSGQVSSLDRLSHLSSVLQWHPVHNSHACIYHKTTSHSKLGTMIYWLSIISVLREPGYLQINSCVMSAWCWRFEQELSPVSSCVWKLDLWLVVLFVGYGVAGTVPLGVIALPISCSLALFPMCGWHSIC